MEKDEKDKVSANLRETDASRREVLRLVGAAIAAGSIGVVAKDVVAQTASQEKGPKISMGSERAKPSAVIQKIINDPKVLNQLEAAKTGTERRQVLASAGLTSERNPKEVQEAVMQILSTHGRPGGKVTPHVIGRNDWGPGGGDAGRTVEWVAAVAALLAI
jgi:hypothetical protein